MKQFTRFVFFMLPFLIAPFLAEGKDLQPGKLSVQLSIPGDVVPKVERVLFDLQFRKTIAGKTELSTVYRQILPANEAKFVADDLSPGEYRLLIETSLDTAAEGFRLSRVIHLADGEEQSIKIPYQPNYQEQYWSNQKVVILIKNSQGKPLSNREYTLEANDRTFGRIELQTGTIEEGRIEFDNLNLDKPYRLYLGHLGRFPFTFNEERTEHVFEFITVPTFGDLAPDFTVQELTSRKEVSLSGFRGKVVFIDFWATWCPPCTEPMRKSNDIMSRRKKDWEGKALILTVSCDETKEALHARIEKEGWIHPYHTWAHNNPGWESVPMRTYGIAGIPTAVLVDQAGKIIWRGLPYEIDVETEIDRLIGN